MTEDVDKAVSQAKTNFPIWSNTPLEKRIAILKNFASLVEKKKEELALTISQEMGKPLWESRGEVGAMVKKVAISLKAFDERCQTRKHPEKEAESVTRFFPHGVCAVFGPFNFPAHLPTGHIVPALLAGNTIVFKPSENTPKVGQMLVNLWQEANLPKGVLNLVQGGATTGEALASHPEINALFFTGSCHVGALISEQFGSHPEKILALEMGGNNPLCLGSLSELDAAIYMILQSAYLTTGQRCTCARRLIVLEKDKERIIEALVPHLDKIAIGPYDADPEPFMGPLVSEKAAMQVLEKQAHLLSLGADPLHPMKHLKGAFVTPGLIDVTGINNLPDVEIFGPLLQLKAVSNFDALITEANNTRFGLCASLLSEKKEEWDQFLSCVKAGVINWNRPTNGASSLAPFGGIGWSGNGRPSGYFAADYCSYPVASLQSNTLKLPEKPLPGLNHDSIKL